MAWANLAIEEMIRVWYFVDIEDVFYLVALRCCESRRFGEQMSSIEDGGFVELGRMQMAE